MASSGSVEPGVLTSRATMMVQSLRQLAWLIAVVLLSPLLTLGAVGQSLPLLPRDALTRYHREADVVAVGKAENLRIEGAGSTCCRVLFTFRVGRFLKGKDDLSFVYSFEPRGPGLSQEEVRAYYGGSQELVFFYRKSGAAGAVKRDSLWIARGPIDLRELLEK
jgi:hypothetical protein